ncbi:sigma-70 family RNA polymerase sigma factor [Jatrophihabitans sp.]|uniref:sigma-70 family RNA polymerase sigma factor n=1 Tax=Jatrophihabitans sp. TaxID=1932789 RepID=UPI0030C6A413|nr:polymerase sigma 70 [Jatrophihabitans sp.]
MTDDALADRFEQERFRLRGVALRMLGSISDADDAVQETWLRLSRVDVTAIENLSGWLTTVIGRVCLDLLRSRTSRREEPLAAEFEAADDPEHEALLAASVGPALLVVLELLAPAERLAFVLHDLFGVPFDEIAAVVGRTPAAARQLASRARRRVQGASPVGGGQNRQREIVAAFLAASRDGDLDSLVALLDPEVVLRGDAATVAMGGVAAEARGVDAVVQRFAGGAKAARMALLDGAPGLVWMHRGETRVVFDFTVVDGRILAIDLLGDAETLAALEIELLPVRPA